MLKNWGDLNHRQIALLSHAMRHPGKIYTIEGHQTSHDTVYETARRDLLTLSRLELLEETKRGKLKTYRAPGDLHEKIQKSDSRKRAFDSSEKPI